MTIVTKWIPALSPAVWLGAVALSAMPAGAQNPVEGLRLTLELGEAEVVLGEPVYATVTLRNVGSGPVSILPDLSLESGFVQIEVGPPDGKPFPFVPLAIDDVEVARLELAPGAAITGISEVFFGGRGWTFDRPGSYSLTASYEVPGVRRLSSEPAVLSVAESDGAGRALLSADPETVRQAGKFLVWQQGDHLRRALLRLEGLVERYPESEVADHVRLAMGVNLSRSFYDYTAGGVRPARPEEALQLLDAVRETSLPGIQRLRLHLARNRCHAALGRKDEADAALDAARKLTTDRPALETLLKRMTQEDL